MEEAPRPRSLARAVLLHRHATAVRLATVELFDADAPARREEVPLDCPLEYAESLARDALGYDNDAILFLDASRLERFDGASWATMLTKWVAGEVERREAKVLQIAQGAIDKANSSAGDAAGALVRIQAFEEMYELLEDPANATALSSSKEGAVMVQAVLDGLQPHDFVDEVSGAAALVGWKMAEVSATLASQLVERGAAQKCCTLLQHHQLERLDSKRGGLNAKHSRTRRVLWAAEMKKLRGEDWQSNIFCTQTLLRTDAAARMLDALQLRSAKARAVLGELATPWLLSACADPESPESLEVAAHVLCTALARWPRARHVLWRCGVESGFNTILSLVGHPDKRIALCGVACVATVLRGGGARALLGVGDAEAAFWALQKVISWCAAEAQAAHDLDADGSPEIPELLQHATLALWGVSAALRDKSALGGVHERTEAGFMKDGRVSSTLRTHSDDKGGRGEDRAPPAQDGHWPLTLMRCALLQGLNDDHRIAEASICSLAHLLCGPDAETAVRSCGAETLKLLVDLIETSYSLDVRVFAAAALARASQAPSQGLDALYLEQKADLRLCGVLQDDVGSRHLEAAISAVLLNLALYACVGHARRDAVLKQHVALVHSHPLSNAAMPKAVLRRGALSLWALARGPANRARLLFFGAPTALVALLNSAASAQTKAAAAVAMWLLATDYSFSNVKRQRAATPGPAVDEYDVDDDDGIEDGPEDGVSADGPRASDDDDDAAAQMASPPRQRGHAGAFWRDAGGDLRAGAGVGAGAMRGVVERHMIAEVIPSLILVICSDALDPNLISMRALATGALAALARSEGGLRHVAEKSQEFSAAILYAARFPGSTSEDDEDASTARDASKARRLLQTLAVELVFRLLRHPAGADALLAAGGEQRPASSRRWLEEVVCELLAHETSDLRALGAFHAAKLACAAASRLKLAAAGAVHLLVDAIDEASPADVVECALHALLNLSVEPSLRMAICENALIPLLRIAHAALEECDGGSGANGFSGSCASNFSALTAFSAITSSSDGGGWRDRGLERRYAQSILCNLAREARCGVGTKQRRRGQDRVVSCRERMFARRLIDGSRALARLISAGGGKALTALHDEAPILNGKTLSVTFESEPTASDALVLLAGALISLPQSSVVRSQRPSYQLYLRAKYKRKGSIKPPVAFAPAPVIVQPRNLSKAQLNALKRHFDEPVSKLWERRPLDLAKKKTKRIPSMDASSRSSLDSFATSRGSRSLGKPASLSSLAKPASLASLVHLKSSASRIAAAARAAAVAHASPRHGDLESLDFQSSITAASDAPLQRDTSRLDAAVAARIGLGPHRVGHFHHVDGARVYENLFPKFTVLVESVEKVESADSPETTPVLDGTFDAETFKGVSTVVSLECGAASRPSTADSGAAYEESDFYFMSSLECEVVDPGAGLKPLVPMSLSETLQLPPRLPQLPAPEERSLPLFTSPPPAQRPPLKRHALELCKDSEFGTIPSDPFPVYATVSDVWDSEEEAEEKPVWTLATSIFAPRLKEADARSYYETDRVVHRALDVDFNRTLEEDRFSKYISKAGRIVFEVEDVAAEVAAVKAAFRPHYALLLRLFDYYCATAKRGSFSITQPAFLKLCLDIGISKYSQGRCSIPVCAKIFIISNFESDKKTALSQLNEDRSLMRHEFLECVVRIAVALFRHLVDDVGGCVTMLYEDVLRPNCPPEANVLADDFRRGKLYFEDVERALTPHLNILKVVYQKYTLLSLDVAHRVFALREWMALVADCRLLGDSLALKDVRLAFWRARMIVVDELSKRQKNHSSLSWVEFLEARTGVSAGCAPDALARVADAMVLPTLLEVVEFGAANVVDFVHQKNKQKDDSWHQTSDQPLASKIDVLCRWMLGNLAFRFDGALQCGRQRIRLIGTYATKDQLEEEYARPGRR
ncbi:hypothetical protein M885DRAFT_614242 [Pelagophyceae sp. CCMP2097]|nr:hypothetical protein M885DRAFT_614242 [Pelagophyceae sp. CCMP2097]